jgi:hypothetical protein
LWHFVLWLFYFATEKVATKYLLWLIANCIPGSLDFTGSYSMQFYEGLPEIKKVRVFTQTSV